MLSLLTLGVTLSLDNFRTSTALGGLQPTLRRSVKTSFIFALWDSIAPMVGIIVGGYLSQKIDSTADAIAHVNAHGSGHSEAIVTRDTAAARAFQLGVDAACVYVNASTRFTDGGEFGMGAEIGNSTQKLHARGPIGLRELCTFKYLVEGAGHVRP